MMNKPAMFALLLTPAALFADPSVERVIVRQQWPWSTDVKVEYSLSGVDANNPVDISVRAFNGETELPSANLDAAIIGERYGVTSAVGSFMIDPVAAFGTSQVALGNFSVQLTVAASAANMQDILYKIVDLDSPYTVTDVRRCDFYNGTYGNFVTNYTAIDSTFSTSLDDVLIWLDVTNDVYKTDKMVFRRIPAAGKSYMMLTNNASVNGGAGVEVSFTKDFYIGVYEVTQTQLNKFYRWWGDDRPYPAYPPAPGTHCGATWNATYCNSFETNETYRAMRPASNIGLHSGYGVIRQRTYTTLASHEVGDASFCYNMQNKTQLLVDLPTEAMWEYACRAGTTADLYTGQPVTAANLKKISRGYVAGTDRNAGLNKNTAIVGSYLPNAYGLYDMLGNVQEWCLDIWCASADLQGGTDPLYDAENSNYHVLRGAGNISTPNSTHVCHYRKSYQSNYQANAETKACGIRLCIYLDKNDDGTLKLEN